jgi:hypothetical protein
LIGDLVAELRWKDFEHLVDLILVRSGWARISTLGGAQEAIDLEVENPALNECAFVQVKSQADQAELDGYVETFRSRRDRYSRMIFAVHTPNGRVQPPDDRAIQVWTGNDIARAVVRLGLGERLEKMCR